VSDGSQRCAREVKRPPAIVTAAGVELGTMVREGEEVPAKQFIEAKPCGVELYLRLVEPFLCNQHISKTPPHLWIATRKFRR
jgi:hypothetical protein